MADKRLICRCYLCERAAGRRAAGWLYVTVFLTLVLCVGLVVADWRDRGTVGTLDPFDELILQVLALVGLASFIVTLVYGFTKIKAWHRKEHGGTA